MTVNCSHDIPLSEDFFEDITVAEIICIVVCGIISLITIGIFTENVLFVRRCFESSQSIIFKSTYILGLYPAVSLFAFFALCFPRAFLVCNLCASIYISFGIYHFMSLLLDYSGGRQNLLNLNKDEQIRLRSIPLCCFCVPPFKVTRKALATIHLLVTQNAVSQILISFVSIVLWLDEKFSIGKVGTDNAALYLTIAKIASTMLGMGGLKLMVDLCKSLDKSLNIKAKRQILMVVLLLHNMQGTVFNILANNDIPECSRELSSGVRARAINNMFVITEMLLLGLVARFMYRQSYRDSQLPLMSHGGPVEHPAVSNFF